MSRLAFALLLLVTLVGAAQGALNAVVDLNGATFSHGVSVTRTSAPTTLNAHTRYYYRIEGTVHGTGVLALVIPNNTNIGTFLEKLQPGASSQLSGFFDNPSGTLPFTFINRPYTGTVATPIGNVIVALDTVGSVDSTGIASFSVSNVTVTFNGSPLADGVQFEAGSKATIGIAPKLQFTEATISVAENGGSAELTISRTTNASIACAVHYTTVNGTAQAGTHYTANSGTVNFADGVEAQTITIDIANDSIPNADRTFTVTLDTPTLGAELGTPSTITVVITDDEPPLTFSNAGFTGLGGGASYGLIHFNTTISGKITGSILSDGRKYPFAGKLDDNGAFTKTFKQRVAGTTAPQSVVLNIRLALDGDSFEGEFGPELFSGERDKKGTVSEPVSETGTFNALLRTTDLTPGGGPLRGFLSLKIRPTGAATFAGSLPDGTVVKGTSQVSLTSKLPIAVGLYKAKAGFLAGETTIAQTDLLRWTGPLSWTKPAGSTGLYGEAGLTNIAVVLSGAPYVPPAANERVLSDLTTSDGAATTILSAGNLPAPISKAVTVDARNKVTVSTPGADKLSIKVAAKTGLFSGSFFDGPARRKFNGIFFQDVVGAQVGDGFFLGADVAGRVLIDPN